jgi:hypothetical protein
VNGKFRGPARGVRRKPGEMNGLERHLAAYIEAEVNQGRISWYRFEGVTLKLADDTRYTPDFLVMLYDGTIECWEAKGFWRDDAKVKIKVAASLFPFVFRAFRKQTKKEGGGWEITTFGGHE